MNQQRRRLAGLTMGGMSLDRHDVARPAGAPVAAVDAPDREGARPPSGRLVTGTSLALVLALIVTSGLFTPPGHVVPSWWPASGVAVCLVALSPRMRWPELLALLGVVSFVGFLLLDLRPATSALLAVAMVAEVLVVVLALVLVRSGRSRAALRTPADLGRIALAALAGSVVMAVGAAAIASGSSDTFLIVWRGVAASHAVSLLLVVPLVLFLLRRDDPVPTSGAELAVQVVLTAGTFAAVFGPTESLVLAALPVPLLVWAAWRLAPAVACAELLAAGALTAWATHRGDGPFAALGATAAPPSLDLLVPAYVAALALMTLPLALTSSERRASVLEALAGRETFHKAISESVIGTMLLRPTAEGMEVLEANGPAAELLGSSIGRLRGRVWTDGLTERQRIQIDRLCHGMSLGVSARHELEMHLRGSTSRWVRLALSWVRDTPEGGLVTAQLVDLTEERDLQFELTQERDLTSAVLDNAQTLIVVLDRDGRILKVNRAVERLCGVTPAEVFDAPLWDVLAAPESRERARAELEKEVPTTSDGQVAGEHDWVTSTGERRTIAWTTAQLRADDPGSLRVFTGRDVTDERRAQRLLQDVLDSMVGTAIIGTDEHGLITFFNPGAEQLLGYSAAEIVGVATPQFFHDPDEIAARSEELGLEPGVEVLVGRVAETGLPERRDWTWIRKDGGRLTVSLTLSRMTTAGGTVTGFLGVAEDVSERLRGEQALGDALAREERAIEHLEELDRIKNDFVSSISHELRTPMTSVLGFTQLLTSGTVGPLTDRQQDLLERVTRNGQRLLTLIEDLLTLSRIEAGTWEFTEAELDLGHVVATAMSATQDLLRDRDLTVTVDTDCATRPAVIGDFAKLEQAVINLVSNALKFTRDGGRVDVSVEVSDGEGVIRVADTGLGIEAQELDQIFERFYRTVTATRAAIPGTGLGLTIVRSIVERHSGSVGVVSTPGEGSTFEIRLPLAP